ncbi:hypothetical protein RCIP0075_00056 [Klebsiella phage RCIP0075]
MDIVRIPRRAIYGDTPMNQKTYKHLTPDMIELDRDEHRLLRHLLHRKPATLEWSSSRAPIALVLAALRTSGCVAFRNDTLVVTGFGYRVLKHHRAKAADRAEAAMRAKVQMLWISLAAWEHPRTDANLALESALAAYLEKTA